jgi:hypothetical protein
MNEDKRKQPDPGTQDGANRQSASSGRYTDFPAASPESNVNPPGAPQSSHDSATEPIPGVNPGNRQSDAVQTPDDAAATADRGTSRRDG